MCLFKSLNLLDSDNHIQKDSCLLVESKKQNKWLRKECRCHCEIFLSVFLARGRIELWGRTAIGNSWPSTTCVTRNGMAFVDLWERPPYTPLTYWGALWPKLGWLSPQTSSEFPRFLVDNGWLYSLKTAWEIFQQLHVPPSLIRSDGAQLMCCSLDTLHFWFQRLSASCSSSLAPGDKSALAPGGRFLLISSRQVFIQKHDSDALQMSISSLELFEALRDCNSLSKRKILQRSESSVPLWRRLIQVGKFCYAAETCMVSVPNHSPKRNLGRWVRKKRSQNSSWCFQSVWKQ